MWRCGDRRIGVSAYRRIGVSGKKRVILRSGATKDPFPGGGVAGSPRRTGVLRFAQDDKRGRFAPAEQRARFVRCALWLPHAHTPTRPHAHTPMPRPPVLETAARGAVAGLVGG